MRTPRPSRIRRFVLIAVLVIVAIGGATAWYFRSTDTRATFVPPAALLPNVAAPRGLPHAPRSVIVIVEENKSYEHIIGNTSDAPYINKLATSGALFTNSFGRAHPSQPNYLALFAGATNDDGDHCPERGVAPTAPNLGSELLAAHRTFRGYSEDLPSAGYAGCTSGQYARKHAPWTNFSNVPAELSVPFSQLTSYDTLPSVAFLIPNLQNDMHSASVARGDAWLRAHVAPLVAWANTHDALVVLTWDESGSPITNHIPTLFLGPMVRPGRYGEVVTHDRVLRTIEDLFGLTHAGLAAGAQPIVDCWK